MKRKNLVTDLFYVLYVISYLVVLLIWGMGASYSQIRYYLLVLAAVVASVSLIMRNKAILYGKEILLTIPLGLLFFWVSLQRANEAHHALLFRTYVQISLIVLPALYAMLLVNLLKTTSLIRLMEATLFCTVIVYFMEPGHRLWDFFNLKNWMAMSVAHSSSFSESNICSEVFFNLFLFFNFYKNAKGREINQRRLRLCYVVSTVFAILCFKRLAMLAVVCIIALNKIVDWRGRMPKFMVLFMALFFTIATYLYTEFVKGNLFPNFDVYHFTTGRDYILSLWEEFNYTSYGYGSSMVLIGRYLEMDLVQIFMELNIVAVFAFSYVYFKIAGTNVYAILIMTYAFLNMLTASSLPGSLSWVITFVIIASISSDKCYQESVIVIPVRSSVRKLFYERKGNGVKCLNRHI